MPSQHCGRSLDLSHHTRLSRWCIAAGTGRGSVVTVAGIPNLLQVVALVKVGLVVSANNAGQDALRGVLCGQGFLKLGMSFGEGFEDQEDVSRTAGDVIADAAWVHDAESILLIRVVREVGVLSLRSKYRDWKYSERVNAPSENSQQDRG